MSNTEQIIAALDRAMDVVSEISQGKRNWTMSVPARPDSDPDLVISAALRYAKAALSAQSAAQEPLHCFPILSEEMRKVLRNENCVYQSEDEIYKALCTAASTSQPSFQSAAQAAEIPNAALEDAVLSASAGEVPDILFDGFAVYSALDEKAKHRTSADNVADVLDAVVKIIRATNSMQSTREEK